jgi:hypothetical protein
MSSPDKIAVDRCLEMQEKHGQWNWHIGEFRVGDITYFANSTVCIKEPWKDNKAVIWLSHTNTKP